LRIDIDRVQAGFQIAQRGKKSRHSPADRTHPSLFQYDYLSLSTLSADVRALIEALPQGEGRAALDLGADKSPYRAQLEARGYVVKTLDVTPASGADYTGTAEETGLPDASFAVVLCTQVLEHCEAPWRAIREIERVLAPEGSLIVSAPHVWFYHPHPRDHWRFTQEGLLRLCRDAGLVPRQLRAQGGSLLSAAQIVNFLSYGILGVAGAPLYALVNLLGGTADRMLPNDLFCHNFACLAQKTSPS
jgi:SAM-dependent methyltransferase